jgi:hypothetical protein
VKPVLHKLGDGIWVADALRTILGSHTPIRMTLIDVGGAGLVHSPIPIRDELREAVDALVPVRFLVAPNRWHHLYVGEWVAAYPQAELHGAPGLAAKRPDLTFHGELGDEPLPAWRGQLEQLVFRAMPIFNEVVFFHPSSRTLILTDLAFNFQEADWGFTGLYVRAAGAYRRFGPSRVTRMFFRDRVAARELMERILAWPFERVVVSHGAIVSFDARNMLREAFAWL